MKPFILLAWIPGIAAAQSSGQYRGPIIDVHLHAHLHAHEHMTRSLRIMKQRNLVLGIVSGSSVVAAESWKAADPGRILRWPSIVSIASIF